MEKVFPLMLTIIRQKGVIPADIDLGVQLLVGVSREESKGLILFSVRLYNIM